MGCDGLPTTLLRMLLLIRVAQELAFGDVLGRTLPHLSIRLQVSLRLGSMRIDGRERAHWLHKVWVGQVRGNRVAGFSRCA